MQAGFETSHIASPGTFAPSAHCDYTDLRVHGSWFIASAQDALTSADNAFGDIGRAAFATTCAFLFDPVSPVNESLLNIPRFETLAMGGAHCNPFADAF